MEKKGYQKAYDERTGRAAQKKYQAEKCKQYLFRFTKTTDADIIEKLDSVPNRLGYIKELIRKDLQK